jgi:hypothetical protein
MSFKNLGRIFSHRNDVYAVTPNAAHVIDDRFLVINQERSGITLLLSSPPPTPSLHRPVSRLRLPGLAAAASSSRARALAPASRASM